MSRKSRSGSRFEVLADDDSGSDSSVHSKRLSKSSANERSAPPLAEPTIPTTERSSSSDSSVHEMRLSRDRYPFIIPGVPTAMEVPEPEEDLSQYLPGVEGAGPSHRLAEAPHEWTGVTVKRTMRSRTESIPKDITPTEVPGLNFVWGHFRKMSEEFEEEGVDALDAVFASATDSQSDDTDTVTKNIMEDIVNLKNTGYIIDYPDGFLGEGFYGQVYRGTFSQNVPGFTSNRFAVKMVDFGSGQGDDTLERRERFETEKYILTNSFHKNIITIRQIINMGDIRSFPFMDNPQQRYMSPDRVYLIMDFADGGDLESWISKNYNKANLWQRLGFIRDLFFGMLYLHSNQIVHGDAHSGNVLMFLEENQWVAKWADFGLGFVGGNKQYRYKLSRPLFGMQSYYITDIRGLLDCITTLTKDRYYTKKTTPEEEKIKDQIKLLVKALRSKGVKSLYDILAQFKHILEDELEFTEQFFQ